VKNPRSIQLPIHFIQLVPTKFLLPALVSTTEGVVRPSVAVTFTTSGGVEPNVNTAPGDRVEAPATIFVSRVHSKG
jgi:hypothetical protein